MNDRQLLNLYIERHDESAFSVLTRRYVNLVYSTCLREARNVPLAEDATQAVFLLLARKASSLHGHRVLSGWLFHTARLASKNALRNERCRQEYERKAVEQQMQTEPVGESAWSEIDVRLHDALEKLAAKDRDTILLRFFEDLSLSEVGQRLGVTEDAARLRVNRALARLRARLQPSGTPITVAALAGLLTAHTVQPASAACLHAIDQIPFNLKADTLVSVLAGTPSHQIVQGVLKTMMINKLQIAAVIGATAVCGCAVVHTYAISLFVSHAGKTKVIRLAQDAGKASSVRTAQYAGANSTAASDPYQQFQMPDGFSLTYTAIVKDVRTSEIINSDLDGAAAGWQHNVGPGKMTQSAVDEIVNGLREDWSRPHTPREYQAVISSNNGKLIYKEQQTAGDNSSIGLDGKFHANPYSKTIVAYDGHKTYIQYQQLDGTNQQPLRVAPALRIFETRGIFFPGAGLPEFPMLRVAAAKTAAVAPPGAILCEIAGLPWNTTYIPCIVWSNNIDGSPQITKIVLNTIEQPLAIWTFNRFIRLHGRWIARHAHHTSYGVVLNGKIVAPYPTYERDYTISTASPTPLSPEQVDIRGYLTPGQGVQEADNKHYYSSFKYVPQDGDLDTQLNANLAAGKVVILH